MTSTEVQATCQLLDELGNAAFEKMTDAEKRHCNQMAEVVATLLRGRPMEAFVIGIITTTKGLESELPYLRRHEAEQARLAQQLNPKPQEPTT